MMCVCVEECDWLRLGKFCHHQSTRVYFKGRAHVKIILKNTVGLIGETPYLKIISVA